jgi:DNA-binding MarR family transcriptional regulator
MTISEEFSQVLHDWSETFMRRSMHEFIQFSKESGLSMHQIRTLFHLRQDGRCGVSEIGDLLGVTNPAASQMIDRLVLNGYIERTEDPTDRRAKRLKLTFKGSEIVNESIEILRRWMERLTDVLSLEEQKSIISALLILTKTAQDMDPREIHSFGNLKNEMLKQPNSGSE